MRTFRSLMIAAVAIVVLTAATPAFAQTFADTTARPAATTQAPVQKQQGLGVFVQGGYVMSNISGQDLKDFNPQGFLVGIGFGGNKSGAFGVGVDLNYIWKTETDEGGNDIKTQTLNIPVYGRFNIGGHNTKNAFTFYIPAGWFFDILMSGTEGGNDIKNLFESFQTGPMVGAGFEVARIAVEARGQWALMNLLKTDNGNPAGKPFTFIVLLKVRLN